MSITEATARPRSLPAAFETAAAAHPDQPAIVCDDIVLSYAELDAVSNQLGHTLAARDIGVGSRIGVQARRSPELFQVVLGLLKIGACVVPLNPDYPAAMLRSICEQSKLAAVLAPERPNWLPDSDRLELVPELMSQARSCSTASVGVEVDPESAAFILFTSGSTGRSKGVCIAHRGISRVAGATAPVPVSVDDRILQTSPFSFAASTTEVWFSLLHGACLVLAPPGKPSLPELAELIVGQGVTFLNLPAGLFTLLVEHELDALRGLRTVLVSGDFVSIEHVQRLIGETSVTLYNGFGCTENSALTSALPVTAERVPADRVEAVPLGDPLPGVTMDVLDDALQPVASGEVGELCIGGVGLALGYLNQPDLTAAKFAKNPNTGRLLLRTGDLARSAGAGGIVLVGRTDDMVKVRGFRVELREVERVIGVTATVSEVVVKAFADDTNDKRLVAFYTTPNGIPIDEDVARERLQASLPDYMVPTEWRFMREMPLNVNGKTDRLALTERTPAGGSARSAAAQPLPSDLSGQIGRTFSDILGSPMRVDESFWSVGGTSLNFIELAARLQDQLGAEVRAEDVMQYDSPQLLAAHLGGEPAGAGVPSAVPGPS